MSDIIPQDILDAPGFKCLAITTPHDREKTDFVLGYIKVTVMKKLGADDFHASLSNAVYDQILNTSSDVEGILLRDNKALRDELQVISQQVVDEVLCIEQGITDGTIGLIDITNKVF